MSTPTSDAAHAVREARARLKASIDALSEHVSPSGALDMARAFVEDHDSRRAAVDFVKRNPLPTALAASGLAWLGYKLISGGDDRLADPKHEPGLTEVAGRAYTPESPHVIAHQPAPPAPPPAPPAPEPPSTASKVRGAFRRHPLLYGVVGLVAGAIAGVIAVLKRGGDDALEAPADPSEGPATYAAGEPAAPRSGNGITRRPRASSAARPTAH